MIGLIQSKKKIIEGISDEGGLGLARTLEL
jgi:hypothetical protein